MGYERADGSVGIRNYILVLSMVNCSNTVAQQIAAKTGAHVIPIDCGCVEVADHHRRTCLALTAAALNPNVYAAVWWAWAASRPTTTRSWRISLQAASR